MIFLDENDTCRHGFHSVILFNLKEMSHTGKEKGSQEDHKEGNQESHKAKKNLRLRPLRHRGDNHQGGNGCYPSDVLW